MRFLRKLASVFRRHRFASGGTVPVTRLRSDEIPVVISPGRSTTPRPGESHLEAMDRLVDGEDL